MKPRPIHHEPRRHAARGILPAGLLCNRLGEDFELFSDRTEEAVECENLIHQLESIRDAEIGALDIH